MAVKVLERREADRPFCIFLPIINPHPPYRAPAGFDGLHKADALPPLPPPGLPRKPAFHQAIRDRFGLTGLTDADFRRVRARYYDQVSYTDWLLGELLDALERTGRSRDTAVITSSDHGDYAGDYGLIEKWPSGLETCLTHVPLIARIPGGAAKVRAKSMVELYDIMPTFLELAGTTTTHTHFARSLLPQIRGGSGDAERAAFTEGGYNVYEPQAFEPRLGGLYGAKTDLQNDNPETVARCAAVRTAQHTYIERPGGQSELYDRAADPQEQHNLIDERRWRPVRARLQQRLLDWYVNTSGVPEPDRDSRDTPRYYPPPAPQVAPGARERILDR